MPVRPAPPASTASAPRRPTPRAGSPSPSRLHCARWRRQRRLSSQCRLCAWARGSRWARDSRCARASSFRCPPASCRTAGASPRRGGPDRAGTSAKFARRFASRVRFTAVASRALGASRGLAPRFGDRHRAGRDGVHAALARRGLATAAAACHGATTRRVAPASAAPASAARVATAAAWRACARHYAAPLQRRLFCVRPCRLPGVGARARGGRAL